MTTPVNAGFHHFPNLYQPSPGLRLRPPGAFIFHYHFMNRHTRFHAPVKDVRRCIDGKRENNLSLLLAIPTLLNNKAPAYGIIGFRNSLPVVQVH